MSIFHIKRPLPDKPHGVLKGYDHHGLPQDKTSAYALNDGMADRAVREHIEGSLWAFNADFIASQVGIPELTEMLKAYQEAKSEDANEAIKALIEKTGALDKFAEAAARADGRGHFLAPYDGDENEVDFDSLESDLQDDLRLWADENGEVIEPTVYTYRVN